MFVTAYGQISQSSTEPPVDTQFNLRICENGSVWAAGVNNFGQLGQGFQSPYINEWVKVNGLDNIVQVEYRLDYAVAIDCDGNLYHWGHIPCLWSTVSSPQLVSGMPPIEKNFTQ